MLHAGTPLARFVFDSKAVALSTGSVKYWAFMPTWEDGPDRYELSTFDIEKMPHQSVGEIADDVEAERNRGLAGGATPRTIKGWAVMPVAAYRTCGLGAHPDGIPPRHVTVFGWSSDRADKSGVRLAAQRAARAFETGRHRFATRDEPGK